MPLTPEQFHYASTNTLTEEESRMVRANFNLYRNSKAVTDY